MTELILHHVSILTTDVDRSAAFYGDIFGWRQLPRPNFPIAGAWLGCGDRQVHLVYHPEGTFRRGGVDNNDTHFAIRTDDFEAIVSRLVELGFREDLPADDPRHLMVKRTGAAGFAQVYFLDPDRNVVEVNAAPL